MNISPSRLFVIVLLAFLAGVLAGSFVVIPPFMMGAFFVSAIAIGAFGVLRVYPTAILAALVLMGMVAGILRISWDNAGRSSMITLDRHWAVVTGVVADEPREFETAVRYALHVRSVNGKPIVGSSPVDVLVRKYPSYHMGDLLEVSGTLSVDMRGERERAAMKYPEVKKIVVARVMRGPVASARMAFFDSLERALAEPHSGYIKGLLLGDRNSLPAAISEQFRLTGTSHVLAVSGYNVSVVTRSLLITFAAMSVPFGISMGVAASSVVLFVLAAGASPPIVRAGIMALVLLVASREGRPYHADRALLIAAAGMVAYDPFILREDAGFQLSVLATMGIIFLTPFIERRIFFILRRMQYRFRGPGEAFQKTQQSAGKATRILAETLGAQIAVMPAILFYFGSFSPLSPFINLAILIVMPATMGWGFVAGMAGFFWEPVMRLASIPASVLASYQLSIVSYASRVPGVSVTFSWIPAVAVAGFCAYLLIRSIIRTYK